MGINYSHHAKAIDQHYCDFCHGLTNHQNKDHVCSSCKKIGDHSASKHITCKYCLGDHFTIDHRCLECELNHGEYIHKDQKCLICDGQHDIKYHRCQICKIHGHEKVEEEHDQCKLCDPPKKFTHHISNHYDYLDLENLTKEDFKKFKCCFNCNKIVYVEKNVCCGCNKELDEYIICKKGCGFKFNNILVKYCPCCGNYLFKNEN